MPTSAENNSEVRTLMIEQRLDRMEKAMEAILQCLKTPALSSFGEIKKAESVPKPEPEPVLKPAPEPIPAKSGPYQYSSLDIAKSEIRLLALYGCNKPTDPIKGEVLHVSLDINSRDTARFRTEEYKPLRAYTALSYCWGAPKLDGMIILNGHEFPVTKSLEEGLRQVRFRKGKPAKAKVNDLSILREYYWIDQICINQADIAERSNQVALMRRIYKNARQVMVWLGSEADDSTLAAKVINAIGQSISRGPGEKEIEYPEISTEQKQRNWRAVRAFYQRGWWQRAWIRQEITVTADVIMKCGSSSIDYRVAIDAARHIASLDRAPSSADISAVEPSEFRLPFNYHAHNLSVLTLQVAHGSKFAPLSDVLLGMRGCKATDPRDMINAILGLADPEKYQLVADYRATKRDIYVAATKAALLNDKDGIKILGVCQNPKRKNGFPSWIPNLTDNWKTFRFTTNANLAGLPWTDPEIMFDGDCLLTRGYPIDEIDLVSEALHSEYDSQRLSEVWLKWKAFVGRLSFGPRRKDDDYVSYLWQGNYREQAWLRFLSVMNYGTDHEYSEDGKLIGDEDPPAKLTWPNSRLAEAYVGIEDKDDVKSKWLRELFRAMRNYCVGRRLLWSKNGMIGLAPSDAKVGDSITVIHGAEFHYILRKVGRRGYVLVGDAYLPEYLYCVGNNFPRKTETIRII